MDPYRRSHTGEGHCQAEMRMTGQKCTLDCKVKRVNPKKTPMVIRLEVSQTKITVLGICNLTVPEER